MILKMNCLLLHYLWFVTGVFKILSMFLWGGDRCGVGTLNLLWSEFPRHSDGFAIRDCHKGLWWLITPSTWIQSTSGVGGEGCWRCHLFKAIPSLKLTACLWKWMIGRTSFLLVWPIFRGLLLLVLGRVWWLITPQYGRISWGNVALAGYP